MNILGNFNIELFKFIQTNNKNPYTTNIIPSRYIFQINRLCNKLLSKNYSLIIKNPIPEESYKTTQITSFINKLHSHNLYTTFDQINNLTHLEIFYIIVKLAYQYQYNNIKLVDIYNELNSTQDTVIFFISIINNFIIYNKNNIESLYIHISSLIDNIYEYGYNLDSLNITYIPSQVNELPFLLEDKPSV